ncbi:hypothetical protein KY311_04605 [Candidatus Woesearchaeota archaeon]|nr:hypothetical protein [Candidatus Woesearchaeota archaeon]
MNRYEQYAKNKKMQVENFIEKTKKNIELADRLRKHSEFINGLSDYENRLHIWNIEEGDYMHPRHYDNPNMKDKYRYCNDPVYRKLAGVRETKCKIGYRWRAGLTFRHFQSLADNVILGIMEKVEKRHMKEPEYMQYFNTPRSELYSQILKKVHELHKKGLEKIGYEEKPGWHHREDSEFKQMRDAERAAAKMAEKEFNIDLSGYYPPEKRYTMADLNLMARCLIHAGKVDMQ